MAKYRTIVLMSIYIFCGCKTVNYYTYNYHPEKQDIGNAYPVTHSFGFRLDTTTTFLNGRADVTILKGSKPRQMTAEWKDEYDVSKLTTPSTVIWQNTTK